MFPDGDGERERENIVSKVGACVGRKTPSIKYTKYSTMVIPNIPSHTKSFASPKCHWLSHIESPIVSKALAHGRAQLDAALVETEQWTLPMVW